jgi:hypothetical protein
MKIDVGAPMTKEQLVEHLLIFDAIDAEAKRLGVTIDLANWRRALELEVPTLRNLSFLPPYASIKTAAWSCDVALALHVNPETMRMSTEITWSSTGRSISQATYAISVYRRMLEFAAAVEGIWNS